MDFKNIFLRIWKDAVWSKVIATGIIAIFGGIIATLSLISLRYYNIIPKTVFILVIVILFFTGLYFVMKLSFYPIGKTLLYVSSGGTCRDPMAKAITTKLLENRKLRHPLHVRAMGMGPLTKPEASYAARFVIKKIYHDDLLANHKPELLTPEIVQQADLILVMDKKLMLTPGKSFPAEKTFIFKEFFGLKGDIPDPYPDGKDQVTLSRYRRCAEEIKSILEQNIEHLIQVLDL